MGQTHLRGTTSLEHKHDHSETMWLLSSSRAELKFFISPESVGGYAILSHVWNEVEKSYQDMQALRVLCAQTGQNPRDLAGDKIRRCCELAERHGYQWVWIDLCCIDKTSSAELSEAINSMFRYYSLADVCYAYLEDVPSDRKPDTATQGLGFSSLKFRKSRWHLRGWTLQELVAPRLVLFISQSWDVLGSKTDLAIVLENTTGIPAAVLQFQQGLADMSIAQRMSWAAFRTTTRVEDEAYCLMGIFSINMPTLYGEGRAAFQRLQEEILRRCPDTTLFAWGLSRNLAQVHAPPKGSRHEHPEGSSLFATSPAAFANSRKIRYSLSRRGSDTVSDSESPAPRGVPTFSVTSHGVHTQLPIRTEVDSVAIADLSWIADDVPLGLVLRPCPLSVDPSRPLYDIGVPDPCSGHIGETIPYVRLARIPAASTTKDSSGTWPDICLSHRQTLGPGHDRTSAEPTVPQLLVDNGFGSPFRFRQLQGRTILGADNIKLLSANELVLPWTGSSPMVLKLVMDVRVRPSPNDTPLDVRQGFQFYLTLGRCTVSTPQCQRQRKDSPRHPNSNSESTLGPHWATVVFFSVPPTLTTPPHHDCARDHICDWSGRKNTFEAVMKKFLGHRSTSVWKGIVSLSFSPCPLNPANTLLVHIGPAQIVKQSDLRSELLTAPGGPKSQRRARTLVRTPRMPKEQKRKPQSQSMSGSKK